jgi:hypothetical protein
MLSSRNACQELQATKFEFVINLKMTKTLGIKISDDVLSVVDEVIEYGGWISSSLLSGSGALIRNRRMLSLVRGVTYDTDGSSGRAYLTSLWSLSGPMARSRDTATKFGTKEGDGHAEFK